MKKIGVIALAATMLWTAVPSVHAASTQNDSEKEAKYAVEQFYQAAHDLNAEQYLKYSKDLVYDSKEAQASQIKSLFADYQENSRLVSFEIEGIRKVSDNQYEAEVSQVFDDLGKIPAYEVPVIKENGDWVVVLENINYEPKIQELTVSSNSNSVASESTKLAENNNILVTKPNLSKDMFDPQPKKSIKTATSIVGYSFSLASKENQRYPSFFTAPYNTGTTIKGWQTSTLANTAWIIYQLDRVTATGGYTKVSALDIYKDAKQSDSRTWIYESFSNVPTSVSLSLQYTNRNTAPVNGAGNVYN
ncbi:hypothetical protein [Paenibacillus kandeliae]|uniref:hypothetical protein n=1 Tax=Paenibacillus kandeliae TaxID=3231269 RepID=UPI003458EBB8